LEGAHRTYEENIGAAQKSRFLIASYKTGIYYLIYQLSIFKGNKLYFCIPTACIVHCAKYLRNVYLNIKDSAVLRNHLYAFDNEKWISAAKRDSRSVMVIHIF